MVNYCCVSGCKNNSKNSKHLYYYSVPKETARQEQWLKAADRTDILDKPPDKRILYRFCSRHFSPSSFKNKHLCNNAVPTLCLPGSGIEEHASKEQSVHTNISCDNCGKDVSGFRYKCVTCVNYDLCSRCEMSEAHSQHYMIRIPTPTKSKTIQPIVKKWQELINNTEDTATDDSSDDEPIKKYSKNYDSGVDLSEDVKESIRMEVSRVLAQKKKNKTSKRPAESEKSSKKKKVDLVDLTASFENVPEVVFADVNEVFSVDNKQVDVKAEQSNSAAINDMGRVSNISLMQMKLAEDLSELMMEVSDHKSMF